MATISQKRQAMARRLPVGAEVQRDGGVHFRVWAPRRRKVEVNFVTAGQAAALSPLALTAERGGYFSGFAPRAATGTRYGFRLDDEALVLPDPASRRQPEGPHGPSEVVDPASYAWRDGQWPGISLLGQVFYEMHIGTFTPEGTWQAAECHLPALADLGITTLEVMPVAEFDGQFGWGYDGVDLFAPTRLYGTPDGFRHFVDEAHRHGLGVLLDVVYNHFGPVGNYLGQFSADYLSPKHRTDWGEAVNFDGDNCQPVREFFIANAGYWADEFHIDGLRLDAVQAIFDDSIEHIVTAVRRRVHEAAAGRSTLVVAEDEFQDSRRLRGGDPHSGRIDAAWNDDFHHSARVASTGHAEYYFGDYLGTPQELISAVKWGYLYQGQWNHRQERHRGFPALDVEAPRFVIFLQNHDQVGNSPQGRRLHELTSPGRHRALTAFLLLAPSTPLLFQGQEFSASSRFHYFADHQGELAELVRSGRHDCLRQFGRLAGPDAAEHLADPADRLTFEASKLDHAERALHAEAYVLHRDLLRLRREDPVFAAQRADRLHGSVLSGEAFLLRYLGREGDDRLLLVNLGRDLECRPMTDPLLLPPAGTRWKLLWSSESPCYGGAGAGLLDPRRWFLPGHAAIVLAPEPLD